MEEQLKLEISELQEKLTGDMIIDMDIRDILLNEKTLSKNIPIEYGKISIQTGPIFYKAGDYENLNINQIGYYEIWAKASDNTGKSQPMIVPGWNPKGYINNASPRISVNVG